MGEQKADRGGDLHRLSQSADRVCTAQRRARRYGIGLAGQIGLQYICLDVASTELDRACTPHMAANRRRPSRGATPKRLR